MARVDYSRSTFSKGEPRKRVKARAKRQERGVKSAIRSQVMLRDGFRCRLSWSTTAQIKLGACSGPVEWAHWGPYRRSKTVGQAAERRHVRSGGLALCDKHHDDYDQNRLAIEALTPDECNGRLRFVAGEIAWEETT